MNLKANYDIYNYVKFGVLSEENISKMKEVFSSDLEIIDFIDYVESFSRNLQDLDENIGMYLGMYDIYKNHKKDFNSILGKHSLQE